MTASFNGTTSSVVSAEVFCAPSHKVVSSRKLSENIFFMVELFLNMTSEPQAKPAAKIKCTVPGYLARVRQLIAETIRGGVNKGRGTAALMLKCQEKIVFPWSISDNSRLDSDGITNARLKHSASHMVSGWDAAPAERFSQDK